MIIALLSLLWIDIDAIVITNKIPAFFPHTGINSISHKGTGSTGLYFTPPPPRATTSSSWRLTAIAQKNTNDDDGTIDVVPVPVTTTPDQSTPNEKNSSNDSNRRKEKLLRALQSTRMGFDPDLTPSDRAQISALADAVVLAPSGPTNGGGGSSGDRPGNLRLAEGSSWRLIYGDAPDILGLRGGPLSRLVSIRQEVSSAGLEVVLEYAPSDDMVGLVGRLPQFLSPFVDTDITQDRLEQSVLLDCRQGGDGDGDSGGEEDAGMLLELRPKGTSIRGTRFGDGNLIPALNLQDDGDILASLPFAALSCRIVYNDGDLRIDRSQVDQGNFLGIYRRIR